MDTRAATAIEIGDAIRRGDVTAERVVGDALTRVAEANPDLHAFITVEADRALARARALDRATTRAGALYGVPVAVKDTICVRDMRTTAGSRLLADYRPPYDATAITRLEAAGAVIIGKTNCDEFAMGSSTEHSAFGPSRNPWDRSRTPGGSSGGSAAAVAAGLVPVALGSDTGGSIRQPAAFCGVVGMRPTYGAVSRHGLIAFASSLDQVGPIARTVADCALVQDVIAGADPHDATCDPAPRVSCRRDLAADARGLRIGVPRHLLDAGVEREVRTGLDAALEALARDGAEIDTIELPHSAHAVPVYALLATAEASSNLARYDGVRYGRRAAADTLDSMYARTRTEGFGPEVTRRILLGTYVLSAGDQADLYRKAQQVRALIRRDFERALDGRHAIALPTSPTRAFPLGDRVADPLRMYLSDILTVAPALAGLPAISVPAGLSAANGADQMGRGRLPVGVQLVGRAHNDATVYRLAAAIERHTPRG